MLPVLIYIIFYTYRPFTRAKRPPYDAKLAAWKLLIDPSDSNFTVLQEFLARNDISDLNKYLDIVSLSFSVPT